MTGKDQAGILEQLVELTLLTARATANLINNGNQDDVSKFEPGSLSRANEHRGLAESLKNAFDEGHTLRSNPGHSDN